MIRIYEESKNWKTVAFWTFTYRNSCIDTVEHVDEDTGEVTFDYTLNKKHLQDCLKRLRVWFLRKYGRKLSCKYFACGEYGGKTHRPHAHMCFFLNESRDVFLDVRSFIRRDWESRYGKFNFWNDLVRSSHAVARYVSKYATKGVFVSDWEKERPWIVPSFRLFSKGIGLSYVNLRTITYHYCRDMIGHTSFPFHKPNSQLWSDEYLNLVYSRRCYRFPDSPNISYHLPRYYSDRIFRTKIVSKKYIFKDIFEREGVKRGCPEGLWSKCISVTRYVTHSLLQSQMADFLRERAYKVFDSALERIRQARPYDSSSDVYAVALANENDSMDARALSAYNTLGRFYLRNQLANPALC